MVTSLLLADLLTASAAHATQPPASTLPAVRATGVAVEGSDRLVATVPAGPSAAGIEDYDNAGYRLRRTVAPPADAGEAADLGAAVRSPVTVTVEVELGPIGSDAAFQPVQPIAAESGERVDEPAPAPGPVTAMAREITAKSTSRYGAVSSVLGWLVSNVVSLETAALLPLDEEPLGPDDEEEGGEGEGRAAEGGAETPAPQAGKGVDGGSAVRRRPTTGDGPGTGGSAGAVGDKRTGAGDGAATGEAGETGGADPARGPEEARGSGESRSAGEGRIADTQRPRGGSGSAPRGAGASADRQAAKKPGTPTDRARTSAVATRQEPNPAQTPSEGALPGQPTVPAPSAGPTGAEAAVVPADPVAVLARGSGDAREIAELAVALLRAVGIEARPVDGLVIGRPEVGEPRGPHTWIEVRYPDVGWVFSDPLHHHHYVPATYLRRAPRDPASTSQARAVTTAPAPDRTGQPTPTQPVPTEPATGAPAKAATPQPHGTPEAQSAPALPAPTSVPAWRIVERADRRETVDLYPLGGPGVTARRNRSQQRAAALRVVVSGTGRGSAVLAGEGGRTSKILVGGESVFVGLDSGSYTLEVYLENQSPIVRRLQIGPRERRAVYLRQEPEAVGTRPSPGDDPVPPRPRTQRPTGHRNSP